MGGSRTSSISNNVGNRPPICGCEKVMKMWISNTDENPKRKFWRCRFSGAEYSCELFIWDDELDEVPKKCGKYCEPGCSSILKSEAGCSNCAMTMEFLTQFGKDFGKEFGKEHGTQISAKKHEKLKMKLDAEKKKNFGVIVALAVSWIVFSVVFKLM